MHTGWRIAGISGLLVVSSLTMYGCGSASPAPALGHPTASARQPQVHTLLALILRKSRTADGYRLVLAPATHVQEQYLAIPGRAPVTYDVPASLVADPIVLLGPVVVTTVGSKVTSLEIMGG